MIRFASCGMFCTALLALGAMGCSSEDPVEEPQAEQVEFLTFWVEDAEKAALDKLIEIHKARRPNAEIITTFEANKSYQERLTQRISEQNPPDTFQSNMGQRLLKWVTDSAVNLEEVERGDWEMPTELLDVNSRDGKLYAVPISLIRQSTFYYNPGVLADHDISVADLNQPGMDGVNALLDACATLDAAGLEPFALGNVFDWTLDMLFWEALFPAVVGPDYYEAFWRGEKDPANDPEIDQALSVLLELSQYFNSDSADVDFPEALYRIGDGTHAFGQNGEWGAAMLAGQDGDMDGTPDYTLNEDFGVMPFPGTSKMFIFSQDVLPIMAGTPNRRATQELLNTIATEDLQVEFNLIKGQLPALTGVSISEADGWSATQVATYDHFNDPTVRKVPVVHGFKPDDVMKDLAAIEKVMIDSGDTAELKTYIIANYALLGQIRR
jgi:glucose/mannose transport system substrate-binding protein